MYDFFILTHEYIAVLRKPLTISMEIPFDMWIVPTSEKQEPLSISSTIRKFPNFQNIFDCKILGTIWVYRSTRLLSMEAFCMTQLVS
jgi:hypothetical protein